MAIELQLYWACLIPLGLFVFAVLLRALPLYALAEAAGWVLLVVGVAMVGFGGEEWYAGSRMTITPSLVSPDAEVRAAQLAEIQRWNDTIADRRLVPLYVSVPLFLAGFFVTACGVFMAHDSYVKRTSGD